MNSKSKRSLIFVFLWLSLFLSVEALTIVFFTESPDITFKITRHVFAIVLVQTLMLLFCSWLSKQLTAAFFGAFFALNLLLLKVAFFSSVDLDDEQAVTLAAVVFMLASTWAFFMLKHKTVFGRVTYLMIAFVLGVVPVSLAAYTQWEQARAEGSAMSNAVGQLQKWSKVELKSKPNIYIFSFDAMIPSSSAKNLLGIDNLGYPESLDEMAISAYPAYSIRVPTKPSLNSFMNLDQFPDASQNLYFNGRAPSLMGALLRNNNYEITHGFSSGFFGVTGSYVDHYKTPPDKNIAKSIVCKGSATTGWQSLLFLNVCSMRMDVLRLLKQFGVSKSQYKKVFENNRQTNGTANKKWVHQTFEYVDEAIKRERPQFTFFYVFRPNGHTPSGYNDSNLWHRKPYVAKFRKQAKLLDQALKELHKKIMLNDPNSIVFIFGDHGAYITKGQTYSKLSERGKEIFIEDRHAVQVALLKTDNECASQQALRYVENHATPSRFMYGILDCLSGSQLSESVDTSFIDELDDGGDIIDYFKAKKSD